MHFQRGRQRSSVDAPRPVVAKLPWAITKYWIQLAGSQPMRKRDVLALSQAPRHANGGRKRPARHRILDTRMLFHEAHKIGLNVSR